MNNVLVTAVITTCNRELVYLKRAIESVLNQDYHNIELIIIDDSSPDYILNEENKNYCESLKDKNVLYYRNDVQIGACASRNKGLELSTGQYIAFLDDDDEWISNKISSLVEKINKSPDIGMVYSDFWIINENDNSKKKYSDNHKAHVGFIYDKLIISNFIGSTSSPLLNKSSLIEVGGFDINQPAMQDWDVWIRIAEKFRIEYVSKCLINYYIHKGEHISKNPTKRLNGLMLLNEKQKEYLDKHTEAKVSRYYYIMRLYIAQNDIKNAVRYYKKVVKCQPKNILDNIIKLKSFMRLFIKPSKGWS